MTHGCTSMQKNTCTHPHTQHTQPASHTHTHSNKPQSSAGHFCSCCPPPKGRRCPRRNRGHRSHLKLCWVSHDINSPLTAALQTVLSWGASWVLGPGWRQAQTLQPLLGEQRKALLSSARPLAATTGSLCSLFSSCTGTWGQGIQGLAEGPLGSA